MPEHFDLIIKNASVLDGTGSPAVAADIGIKDDRIAAVGKLDGQGKEVIDAMGSVAAPGFIDIHSHSDFLWFIKPESNSKILDGVTTEICGNCGSSPFPLKGQFLQTKQANYKKYGLEIDWEDVEGLFSRAERTPSSINRGFLAGHGSIRAYVMDFADRAPTSAEIEAMKGLVRESIEAGAFGLSSGLIYAPSCFASTEELSELCREVNRFGGIYTTHMRSEGDGLLEAVKEAIEISRQSGVSLQISHLKTSGRKNWQKLGPLQELLNKTRREGVRLSCDRYPYIAASTNLDALLPKWVFEGGIDEEIKRIKDPSTRKRIIQEILNNSDEQKLWQRVVISAVHSGRKELEGKNILELGRLMGKPPAEAALDLLVEEDTRVWILLFSMCEENLEEILKWDFVSIGSDSSIRAVEGPLNEGKPHPRCYGTFSRVLGHYVRNRRLLPLEEAVKKMTSMPSEKLCLDRRGMLKEGYFADITIFDPKEITDCATYEEPHQYSKGIKYVVVNGKVAVKEGKLSGIMNGSILRFKPR